MGSNPIFRSILGEPEWRNGRRGGLKNRWGVTPVSVRIRPSALVRPLRKFSPHQHRGIGHDCFRGFQGENPPDDLALAG